MLDTDVIVAAMRSKHGASQRLVIGALNGEFTLLISVALALEYEAVLTRPEQLSVLGTSREDVCEVVADLITCAEKVRISYQWRPQLSDADDELVLDTAVNGKADAIVTFNQRDYSNVEHNFACKIMPPAEALRWLRSLTV